MPLTLEQKRAADCVKSARWRQRHFVDRERIERLEAEVALQRQLIDKLMAAVGAEVLQMAA